MAGKYIPRFAEEFLAPSQVIYQGIHRGSMPGSGSFLSVNSGNIIISSVKQSEIGEDIIIRCVETHGTQSSASLGIGFAGITWRGDFRPYEIKTIRLSGKTGEVKVVSLLEE